jgi:hypothetical protein
MRREQPLSTRQAADYAIAAIRQLLDLTWHADVYSTLEPLIGAAAARESVHTAQLIEGHPETTSTFTFGETPIEAHWGMIGGRLTEIVFIPHPLDLNAPFNAAELHAELATRLVNLFGQPSVDAGEEAWINGDRLVRLNQYGSHHPESAVVMVSIERSLPHQTETDGDPTGSSAP